MIAEAKSYLNQYKSEYIYSRYKGEVPKLSNNRESFEDLLLFLLNNVIRDRYNKNMRYFIRRSTLQTSIAGGHSDVYEMIARTFQGASFYFLHNECESMVKMYLTLIKQGSNPKSKFFWGDIVSNQICVENALLIVGLLLTKPKVWDRLSDKEQEDFLNYIKDSAKREFRNNNWLWFKIFHFIFLEKYGQCNCEETIRELFDEIESYYKGGGWYRDGLYMHEIRYDNCTSWVFYYVGLFFCYFASEKYEDIKRIIKKNFQLFKKSFLLCFDDKNLPLAWGRCLMYRFAGLSCFGPAIALNLIDKEDELLQIKKMLIATINNFFKRFILDSKGILTMGYTTKPNKRLLEPYSGDGSPYFSLDVFSFLLLDENHPFWKININDMKNDEIKEDVFIKELSMYIRKDYNHCLLVNGGMNSRGYPNKYNRFASSNIFHRILDGEYLDNLFVFDYVGEKLTRDTVKEIKYSQHNIMYMHWNISNINELEMYTTIIPMKTGYILINNCLSKQDIQYIFSGFSFNAKTKGLLIRKDKNFIEIICGNLASKLAIKEALGGEIGYKQIPGRLVLNGEKSVLPYFKSKIICPKSKVVLCVQSSNGGDIRTPKIVINGNRIDINDLTSENKKLSFVEKNNFYELNLDN